MADRRSSRCRRGRAGEPSTNSEQTRQAKPDTVSQNEMLFIRGKAMSGAPIISGDEPVAEAADEGGHHHEEHHDEAVAVTNTL